MPDFRIYYNRRSEHPTVWSLDSGSQATEINVKSVRLHRCNAETHWNPDIPPNNDTPSAWFEVYHAVLQMHDGVAHLFPDPNWRKPRLTDEVIP